jgi:hypothetical protein
MFGGSLPPAHDRLNHVGRRPVSRHFGRVDRRSTPKGGEMRLGTLLLIIIIVLLVLFLFGRRRRL